MEPYRHTVHYYETDKMGITHHSNYIRWMEEARISFLHQIGWDFDRLESMGIVSPVVETNCRYKAPTTFADEVLITVTVTEFNGVRLKLHYEMKKADGRLAAEGESAHCFMTPEGRLIRLDRQYPELYAALAPGEN